MRSKVLAVGVGVYLLCCLHTTQPSPGMDPITDFIKAQFSAQRLDECFCEVGNYHDKSKMLFNTSNDFVQGVTLPIATLPIPL